MESKNIYPEHFSVKANKYIFTAMLYLKSKNIKPSPMAIMEVLTSGDAKESVTALGGLDYLMTLEETNIAVDNVDIFVEKIKQSYTRKMMYQIAKDVEEFVLSDKAEVLNPSEIIGYAEQKITDLGVNSTGDTEVYKMGEDTEDVLNRRAETPSAVPGLEVGWYEYDRITNGAQAGDLIVICAPSKTGKSVTLTNWATKISIIDQLPVLYIDTEMNSREQEDRILANLSGIPQSEIVSGLYVTDTINGTAEDKCTRLKEARIKLKMGHYYHIYMPQFTIEKVTSLVRKFQMQFGIVTCFFDYIKIPSNQADFKTAQEYQKLGFFTSGLKDLAGMLQIPIFTACQANRTDVGEDAPSEANIGGSYRILQLASKLLFLYNKSEEQIARQGLERGNQLLYIAFQRNGMSGGDPLNIKFSKTILRQEEV